MDRVLQCFPRPPHSIRRDEKEMKFMDVKQGGRYMHDYSKMFNHLA
jgi:hypothetical protein